MPDLGMEDLINKINGCSDDEKRIILEQFDIKILMEVAIEEIERLQQVELNGKRLFGV